MNKNPLPLLIIVLLLGWAFDYLFIGWAYDYFYWTYTVGVNYSIFLVLCLLGGFAALIGGGYRPSWKALLLLIPVAFFAPFTFLSREPLTVFLGFAFSLFSIGLLANTYLGGRWFQYGLSDYFKKFFLLIASMVERGFNFTREIGKERKERGVAPSKLPILSLLRGLLIALPIVAILASLLASGDAVFNQKLTDLYDEFSDDLGENIVRLIFALTCAYLLLGVFLHAAERSGDEKTSEESESFNKRFLGFVETTVILGSVVALFASFVTIQFQYFFGGETNIGVEGLTYSQYARRGFNELVTTAFISLILIMGFGKISRRDTEWQKRVYSALCVAVAALTLVILYSAYQRILLGIGWHGYSRLRLYPKLFLVWVAILFIVVVALEIFRKEKYFALAFVIASFGFGVSLTTFNVDDAIVRFNIDRFANGRHLNVPHLSSLSTDAVPALVDEFLSPNRSVETREGVGAVLMCYLSKSPDIFILDWRAFNLSQQKAREAMIQAKDYLFGYKIIGEYWTMKVKTPSGWIYECH